MLCPTDRFSQKMNGFPMVCTLSHWPPLVQAAGVSSTKEALYCASVGIDALGFTLGLPNGPHDDLTPIKARSIIKELPSHAIPVLITYLSDPEEAARLAHYVSAQAIQLHGGIEDGALTVLRKLCPEIKTIGRVSVTDETAIDAVTRFSEELWDGIILDSYDPNSGKLGATGMTHDWRISARIVGMSRIPVILAGGLNPENVAEAILRVRPAGVDAHSGLEDEDGTRNFMKIRSFAYAALGAFKKARVDI